MTSLAATHSPRISDRELELSAIISAYNDVTERLKGAHERLHEEVARLREELRRKNEELRRSERLAALGEMAAGLAHEIRNPLGGIALYASMLERELSGRDKAAAAASKITYGVRSLERLVSEILDFAQEYRLESQPHRMSDILMALEDAVRPWAEECGGTLTVEPDAGSCGVYCDRHRLHQVLLNLVMNGLQAAGKGGRVRLAATAAGDGTEICVTDTGPGIPEAHLHRIFNPFFTTKASGTGLGLAIVHRIIEAHGGTIRAGNRPEGGARFVIRLPGGDTAKPTVH
ncbi:MAG: two-component sensor histidine kinase [Planctomycetota bacterium]|nr:MAG: two-component sensor histidine kinase [Planctomycetota bacterium]